MLINPSLWADEIATKNNGTSALKYQQQQVQAVVPEDFKKKSRGHVFQDGHFISQFATSER